MYKTDTALQRFKKGLEISANCFAAFVECSIGILKKSGLERSVAVLTYGSAGDRFIVSCSDTDFTLLADDNVSDDDILRLQKMLADEFSKT